MGAGAYLHGAFQHSLNCAIADGVRPSLGIGLGEQTWTAIEAVAREHPDATVEQIADAYDAFAREHEARFSRGGPTGEAVSAPAARVQAKVKATSTASHESGPATREAGGRAAGIRRLITDCKY